MGGGTGPVCTIGSLSAQKKGPSGLRIGAVSSNRDRTWGGPVSKGAGTECFITKPGRFGYFEKLTVVIRIGFPCCSTFTLLTANVLPVVRRSTLYTRGKSRLPPERKCDCRQCISKSAGTVRYAAAAHCAMVIAPGTKLL
jgi:hypothetical protein